MILFSTANTGVVDAVGIHLVNVRAFRLVGDVGQTIPGLTGVIGAVVLHGKQNALRYAIFILAIFGLIPGQTSVVRHSGILLLISSRE